MMVSAADAAKDALTLAVSGRLLEARAIAEAAVATSANPIYAQILGYVAQQIKDYTDAVKWCNRAAELGLRDWSNFYTLGLSLVALDRITEAGEAFSKAVELNASHVDSAVGMLRARVRTHGLASAQTAFDEISAKNSSDNLWKQWASIQFTAGSVDSVFSGAVSRKLSPVAAWASSHGYRVFDIGEPRTVRASAPPVIGIEPQEFSAIITSNPLQVTELHDVTIFARSNIILTFDGVALDDVSTHPKYGTDVLHAADPLVIAQSDDRLLLDVGSYSVDRIDSAIMLSGAASREFGHWTNDFLPRLELYEHIPGFGSIPIIVDDGMPQSHYDYLNLIASAPVIRLGDRRALCCRRLFVASPITFFPVHLSATHRVPIHQLTPVMPESKAFIKTRVEPRVRAHIGPKKKYFISRRNSRWARLSNDDEISALLQERGYEIVMPETLSLIDQIRLYQSASSLVIAGGSAVQGIIFADKSTNIAILTQSNIHTWSLFNAWAAALGYTFVLVCGPAVGNPEEKQADYVIPPDLLMQALSPAD